MSSGSPGFQLSETHLRLCFANAATGIVITDISGRFLQVNPAFSRITGYSLQESIGKDYRQIVAEEDWPGANKDFSRLISGEVESYTRERRYRRMDNSLVWVRVSISLLRDEYGIAVKTIAIVEDISEQRKLEEQIRQSHKMEALGRFAGGIAHDFNNLLMIINSYAELLAQEFGPNSPMGRKATAIEEAGTRAAILTSQLLAFSRKQVLKTQVISIDSLVRSSEQMLRRLMREDIEFSIELNAEGARIEIDPGQIERVLMNLAGNAGDAMPKGGRLTITTSKEQMEKRSAGPTPEPESQVLLTVTDTGIGMDAATQERIFEPFFSFKKRKGTGLGLSTVYGIIEQSRGQIKVESAPGRGTTFRIYLPTVDRKSEPESVGQEVVVGQKRKPIRATVLLVEDEEILRRCLINTLSSMGCNVLHAQDGTEALALVQRQLLLVDLVVTDMVMPRLGGLDLVRNLRTLRPKLPVIFMSGYTDVSPSHEELRSGATQFIQKPFSPDILRNEVEGMLRRAEAARQLQ